MEPIGVSVVGCTCIFFTSIFFLEVGKDIKPAWVYDSVILRKDIDKMALIIPS